MQQTQRAQQVAQQELGQMQQQLQQLNESQQQLQQQVEDAVLGRLNTPQALNDLDARASIMLHPALRSALALMLPSALALMPFCAHDKFSFPAASAGAQAQLIAALLSVPLHMKYAEAVSLSCGSITIACCIAVLPEAGGV